MTEKVTKRINLIPYLAAAIARNDRAYARGRMLYYDKPAECEAEALKSGCKNHRAITSCRAEYELKARQMLGIICYYDEADITPVIAHGWRQLYSAIKNDKAVNVKQYENEDDDATDILFVSAYFCRVLEKPFPERLQPIVVNLVESYEQAPADVYVSPADRLNGNTQFPSRKNGTAALDDVAEQQAGKPFELLAHFLGLGLSDYLYGTRLTTEQKAICSMIADGDETLLRPLGYFTLLINAIKADRNYLLSSHSEKLIIEAKQAKIRADKQLIETNRANDQLNRALGTIAELQRELDKANAEIRKLNDELNSHEGDAQEIASLRSALYKTGDEQEDNTEETNEVLTPPDKKIICIGGHQRWIDQMQKALPSVKFIPAGVTLDCSMLANYDAVWFRSDYLSHKQFYPAIDVCRENHVPVYYFSGKGAARCIAEICTTR